MGDFIKLGYLLLKNCTRPKSAKVLCPMKILFSSPLTALLELKHPLMEIEKPCFFSCGTCPIVQGGSDGML